MRNMKWFFKELLNPKGEISAPQTIGCLLGVFACILAAFVPLFPIYKDVIFDILGGSILLLTGGSFEVWAAHKFKGQS